MEDVDLDKLIKSFGLDNNIIKKYMEIKNLPITPLKNAKGNEFITFSKFKEISDSKDTLIIHLLQHMLKTCDTLQKCENVEKEYIQLKNEKDEQKNMLKEVVIKINEILFTTPEEKNILINHLKSSAV